VALTLVPLLGTGARGAAQTLTAADGRVTLALTAELGTHWFALEAR
jgi:hypothetical protein